MTENGQDEEDPSSMAADTPMAICLAASVADSKYNDSRSVDDAGVHDSSDDENVGGSLMDAYKEVLSSQVSNFDCFTKNEYDGRKKFKFDE